MRVGVRILLLKIGCNRLQVLIDLFDGDTGFHASKGVEKMRATLGCIRLGIAWIVVFRESCPKTGSGMIDGKAERLRHDSDDGVEITVELELASEYRFVGPELRRPQRMADQYHP